MEIRGIGSKLMRKRNEWNGIMENLKIEKKNNILFESIDARSLFGGFHFRYLFYLLFLPFQFNFGLSFFFNLLLRTFLWIRVRLRLA